MAKPLKEIARIRKCTPLEASHFARALQMMTRDKFRVRGLPSYSSIARALKALGPGASLEELAKLAWTLYEAEKLDGQRKPARIQIQYVLRIPPPAEQKRRQKPLSVPEIHAGSTARRQRRGSRAPVIQKAPPPPVPTYVLDENGFLVRGDIWQKDHEE